MSKQTIELAATVLKEIKAECREGAIKDTKVSRICNIEMNKLIGHVVIMTLSGKFDYTSPVLENWRKCLEASDYTIGLNRNQLQIRFYVIYKQRNK